MYVSVSVHRCDAYHLYIVCFALGMSINTDMALKSFRLSCSNPRRNLLSVFLAV